MSDTVDLSAGKPPDMRTFYDCFTSQTEHDQDGGAANIVDGLFAIARSLDRIAAAIRASTETVDSDLKTVSDNLVLIRDAAAENLLLVRDALTGIENEISGK